MKSTLVLAVRIFCLLLFCGRTGLLLHELAGHGLAALLLNCPIQACHISLFGGACVHYSSPSHLDMLLITAAGVTSEWVLSLVCFRIFCWHRVSGNLRSVALALGLVLAIHPFFYMQDGLWYGYGDARILFPTDTSQHTAWLSIALLPGMALLSLLLFKNYATDLLHWLKSGSANSTGLPGVLTAAGLAMSLHAGLTMGEARLAHAPVCASVFIQDHELKVEREMVRYRRNPSLPQDPASILAHHEKISRELAPWPMRCFSVPLTLLAMLTGTLLAKKTRQTCEPQHIFNHTLTLLTLAVMAIVAFLRASC